MNKKVPKKQLELVSGIKSLRDYVLNKGLQWEGNHKDITPNIRFYCNSQCDYFSMVLNGVAEFTIYTGGNVSCDFDLSIVRFGDLLPMVFSAIEELKKFSGEDLELRKKEKIKFIKEEIKTLKHKLNTI